MSKIQIQKAPGNLEIIRAFLNTWRIPHDTRIPTDSLQTVEEVQYFQSTYFTGLSTPVNLDMIIKLRLDIRSLLGTANGTSINTWLVTHPVAATLEFDGADTTSIKYKPARGQDALCGELLAIVVESFAIKTWSRLKACPDCQWVFYDYSKNTSKVWCGMLAYGPKGRACGSIAKVRHWRERQKAK